MTLALTAPISEQDYKNMPLLAIPSDYTGDKVTMLLNQAWDMIQGPRGANQPLSSKESTLVEEFGSRYCNWHKSGNIVIEPRYLPIISVTSIEWSNNPIQLGWTHSLIYNIQGDQIFVQDMPFCRGDWGLVRIIYTSGYAVVPDALKMACGLMAAHLFSGSMFPSQTGGSVLPAWLPGDVNLLIEKYKRVR